MVRVAVVGHVEVVTFAVVDRVPEAGEIIHAREFFDLPAGGGPVAAVQLAKLAGSCEFFTALGDDEAGHRALRVLRDLGLRVHAVFRPEPQRRAFSFLDRDAERTITVMGPRLGPHASDPLPWDELAGADGVYFCAGDDDALRAARRARRLVVTTREADRLARVALPADAAVGSANDPSERFVPYEPGPMMLVATEGAAGGTYTVDGAPRRFAAPRLDGPAVDAYGAGDSFAGGLTYALAAGMVAKDAVALASACGAACVTGRGPYDGQRADFHETGQGPG